MAITWTKKHIAAMADVLDSDHDTVEGAAEAALDAALEMIEERAKFAVVGQVYYTLEHGKITPDHPDAVRMCLGLFATETQALEAAGKLFSSTASGDELKTWVVPMFYDTPAAWHAERRKHYAEVQRKVEEKRKAKFLASIEQRTAEANARAAEIRSMEEAAGGQHWPCPKVRVEKKECQHTPTCK